jgi:hypothetical protein
MNADRTYELTRRTRQKVRTCVTPAGGMAWAFGSGNTHLPLLLLRLALDVGGRRRGFVRVLGGRGGGGVARLGLRRVVGSLRAHRREQMHAGRHDAQPREGRRPHGCDIGDGPPGSHLDIDSAAGCGDPPGQRTGGV